MSRVAPRLLHRRPDLALVDPTEPTYRPANFISGYESMPGTAPRASDRRCLTMSS